MGIRRAAPVSRIVLRAFAGGVRDLRATDMDAVGLIMGFLLVCMGLRQAQRCGLPS